MQLRNIDTREHAKKEASGEAYLYSFKYRLVIKPPNSRVETAVLDGLT